MWRTERNPNLNAQKMTSQPLLLQANTQHSLAGPKFENWKGELRMQLLRILPESTGRSNLEPGLPDATTVISAGTPDIPMLESAQATQGCRTHTSPRGSILLHSLLQSIIMEPELPVCPVPDHCHPYYRLRSPSRVRPLLYRKMFLISQDHLLLSRKVN